MIFETIIVGPFMMNCYILGCEKSHKAVVIDPGDEPDNILEKLKELGLSLEYILLTHAHIDHIGAVAELVQQTGAKVLMHKNDDFLRLNAGAQAKMFNLPVPGKFTVDQYITDDQIIDLGPYQIKVIHTPGHSPGCVCYLLKISLFPVIHYFMKVLDVLIYLAVRFLISVCLFKTNYLFLIKTLKFIPDMVRPHQLNMK